MTLETSAAGAGASPVDGPYAWYRLAVSLTIGSVGGIGMWAYTVVLPAVEGDFGVDRATASLPFTMTMIGFALGNVIMGRIVDRMGIVIPCIAAAVTLGTGFMLSSLASEIWQFAAVHGVLIGIGMSATFGPLIADLSHWFDRRRGVAVAIVASGNYIAGTVWPPLLQSFVETDGWRATYVGIGITYIVLMVPLILLLRRPTPGADGDADDSHAAARLLDIDLSPRRLQIMLAIAGVGCCVAMSMPQVHIVAYCVELGFGAARGAEMLSLMLAGGIASRVASGVLADYIGGVRTLLLSSALQCVALVFYLPFDGLASLYVSR